MMRLYIFSMFVLGIVVFLFLSVQPSFDLPKGEIKGGCPVNMAPVGNWCVDIYEASVWSLPPQSNGTPQGTQFGVGLLGYPCSPNGNDCSDSAANPIYAASAPGETPSQFITWFQAQQACGNVGKQLPPNAIWQMAAAGTPTDYEPGADDGVDDCNTSTAGIVVPTGSRSNCVSNWGVFDMVGNVGERVADWMQDNSDIDGGFTSTALYGMDEIFGIDEAVPEEDGFPAALIRGGFADPSVGAGGGVFTLAADAAPSLSGEQLGFRCARNR